MHTQRLFHEGRSILTMPTRNTMLASELSESSHNASNNHSLDSLRSESFTKVRIEEVAASSNILLSPDPTTLAILQDDHQNFYP